MRDPTPARSPGPFQVYLDDHYRFLDEADSAPGPSFQRFADAVEWCRARVEESLRECWLPGLTAEELLGRYKRLGDDPWLMPGPRDEHWSASDYAAEIAGRICAERQAAVRARRD